MHMASPPWTAYHRKPDYTLLEYICEDNREYIDELGLRNYGTERKFRREGLAEA
jgi:hypothetical protein